MANGKDEPIEFTRGDAERLVRIEADMASTKESSERLHEAFTTFEKAHQVKHESLQKVVDANTRFRRTTIKVLLWVAGGTISTGAIIKAMEIVHIIR